MSLIIAVRKALLIPGSWKWNGWVRGITARLEELTRRPGDEEAPPLPSVTLGIEPDPSDLDLTHLSFGVGYANGAKRMFIISIPISRKFVQLVGRHDAVANARNTLDAMISARVRDGFLSHDDAEAIRIDSNRALDSALEAGRI